MAPDAATPTSDPIPLVSVACPSCGAEGGVPFAAGGDFEYRTCPGEFTFHRCPRCRVLYLNPRPAPSALARIYPAEYAPYRFDRPSLTLQVRSFLEGRRVKGYRRLLPAEADLVDVGCGGPGFLENLRRHGSTGWRLWGNDINGEVLEDLAARGFAVVPGRFEQVDLPAGSFDGIFLKQVIEHLAAPQAVLENGARLLRPGGLMVIETPNIDAWDARWFRRRHWGGYHFPRHWTLYDAPSLADAVARAGLRPLGTSYLLSPSFWVQSVHHAVLEWGWPAWLHRRISHLNPLAVAPACLMDLVQRLLRGRTSNMRLLCRKEGA